MKKEISFNRIIKDIDSGENNFDRVFEIYCFKGKILFNTRYSDSIEITHPYQIIKVFRVLVNYSLTTGVKAFDKMFDKTLKLELVKLFKENKIRIKERNER